jgi:hypothetical protein
VLRQSRYFKYGVQIPVPERCGAQGDTLPRTATKWVANNIFSLTFVGFVLPNVTSSRGIYSAVTCHHIANR